MHLSIHEPSGRRVAAPTHRARSTQCHSRVLAMILDSTTTQLLRTREVTMLLLRLGTSARTAASGRKRSTNSARAALSPHRNPGQSGPVPSLMSAPTKARWESRSCRSGSCAPGRHWRSAAGAQLVRANGDGGRVRRTLEVDADRDFPADHVKTSRLGSPRRPA